MQSSTFADSSGSFATSAPPARKARAARPRDASTLILADGEGADVRVLMGRRNARHRFMPGKWVFPGGCVEASDWRVPCAGALAPAVSRLLEQETSPGRARALAIAAIRETFEETGLLLGAGPAGAAALPAWPALIAAGLRPDLTGLRYVARMITPPQRPKRFDTRFFMAGADRLVSRQPADSAELDELAWIRLEEAQRRDLAFPTRLMVAEIAARIADPARPILFHRFREPHD